MQEYINHRRQPWNKLLPGLGLFLLLLLSLAQFSSNGVVRGGDDEGSGIGGTGRTLSPSGESGIGGTGFKPFLGMNTNHEIEILRNPAQKSFAITAEPQVLDAPPAPISPVATRVARVMREHDVTFNSSTIDISEAVQNSLDINARTLAQFRDELLLLANSVHAESDNSAAFADETVTQAVKWKDVAALLEDSSARPKTLSANPDAINLANADLTSEEAGRSARPERIQRPELPPLQRVTPLQRSAILPPRVQPLRL